MIRTPTVDEVFATQRGRVRAKLTRHVQHCRQRLERLGVGEMAVEVRGTHGGAPSLHVDEDRSPTSQRAFFGAW